MPEEFPGEIEYLRIKIAEDHEYITMLKAHITILEARLGVAPPKSLAAHEAQQTTRTVHSHELLPPPTFL